MQVETYKEKVEKLEKEVKRMINKEDASLMTTLELIDDIQRLGLGYRFEEEIRKALERISSLEGFDSGIEKSLHATALGFRLLRQHGFNYVSQGINFWTKFLSKIFKTRFVQKI